MPPILAQRARAAIYPLRDAHRDNYAFSVTASTGAKYAGHTRDFHGYPFSVHGYYDWRNWAVALALCQPGDTIIEIGANVGTETVGFRDIVGATGKVFAFEPVPSNVAVLKQLVALNGWTNVEVLPVALCDRHGTTAFVPPPDDHSTGVGHIAGLGVAASGQGQGIEVECRPLDSYASALGQARAVFCDTEGAETMVLKGALNYLRQHRPVLVMEASPKLLPRLGSSVAALHQAIRGAGYEAFLIGRLGVSPITNDAPAKAGNCLCLPAELIEVAGRCTRFIRRCALLPCLRGLNPLRR